MSDGGSWPRISIVTPSYDQGHFVEETIRSVLLQGYPDLEYVVVDGGSMDGALEIIRKYGRFFTYWTSEPDRGQAHAIKKGLARSTGAIFNWINSDDVVTRNTLATVARLMAGSDAVAGAVLNFGECRENIFQNQLLTSASLIAGRAYHQPGIWLRTDYIIDCGGIEDSHYFYHFDWDLIIRYLALFHTVSYTDNILVNFRHHENAKGAQWAEYDYERTQICAKLLDNAKFSCLHPDCSRRLRRDTWWRELQTIRNCTRRSTLEKVIDISIGALRDPLVRVDRFTAGAVRALLWSSNNRPE